VTPAVEPHLRCDAHAGIATITISYPAKGNAMTMAMWSELPGLLDRLAADPAIRVLVVQGEDGTFCVGADVSSLPDLIATAGLTEAGVAEAALADFPKPSIASVRGYCIGGGAQLAVACDFRFAAEDAVFGVTPAKLGVVYQGTAVGRLAQLVGLAPAKHLLFSAELVDAAYAMRVRLVDQIVPSAELDDAVRAYAVLLASRSQLSIQATKSHLRALALRPGDVSALVEIDRSWQQEALRSGEIQEGLAAFSERRSAEFPWAGDGRVSPPGEGPGVSADATDATSA